ncbi:MAG: GNAT family N-acetyltransferase [Rickettsiales bacterium]|jgi:hypothetical protein|nr:GNAT family N-acetyltransferase [Rickettsiales bacterium]
MSDVVIRKAVAGDVPDIVRLQRTCDLCRSDGVFFEDCEFAEYIKNGVLLIAENAGAAIGFIMGERLLNGGAICQLCGVEKPHRNGRVARDLLLEFKAALKEKGASWMLLYAIHGTGKLHEYMGSKVGDEACKEVYYDF